jgi:hypothetical protein
LSISARASSGFSDRSASAERLTRSLESTCSSTLRSVAGTSAWSSGSATQSAREWRIAYASWRTTTFSQAASVARSTVSSRRR